MSRPRKPYGPNPPGRLQGTMIKVLAAEVSDQGRLVRGKRYWADDAVVDIVVGHGTVTAEVQGSRPEPYVVTLEAASGAGMPSRGDLWLRCTCPDDSGTGADACKHAVAAMFALSDEISVEPELVARWRSGGRGPRDAAATPVLDEHPGDDDDVVERPADGRLAPVVPIRPELDDLALLLRAPEGVVELPEPDPIVHPRLRDESADEALADALDHLRIRWE